jgi:CheY-like chemotaxis protein
MKTARLLLVEDDQDNLDLLTIVLGTQYQVFSYAYAHEALTALAAVKPQLALLDIGMHPVDGVQCLEAIRGVPGFGDIPAIAITAHARDVDRRSFLAAGFEAVLTKPILDHRELFRAIAALLTPGPHRAIPASP